MPERDMPYLPADLEHAKQLFSEYLYAVAFSFLVKRGDQVAIHLDDIESDLLRQGWDVCSKCGRFQPIVAIVNGEKNRCKDCGVQ